MPLRLGETGERRKGGFVVASRTRSHAKAERSQQTRKPKGTGGGGAGNLFLSRLHICTPWDSSLSITGGARATTKGGVRGTVYPGTRRSEPARRKSQLGAER